MWCDDPLIKAFKTYGYNILRLPSASFCPLLVLESGGRRAVKALGPIAQELPPLSSSTLPPIHQDDAVPDIGLRRTKKVSGKGVANFLNPVFTLLGLDAGFGAIIQETQEISIVLRSVKRDWIARGDLARYFESGTGAGSRHVSEAAERGRLYLVTSILKSRDFGVSVRPEVSRRLQIQAETAGPVGVSVDLAASDGSTQLVIFTGHQALTFGFQAIRLVYEDGAYSDFASAAGIVGYELPASGAPTEGTLVVDEDLVETADLIFGYT
jgi:hypothetical protein